MTDLLNIILECDLRKLKIFVDDGINVNYKIPDTDGCSILHILAGMGKKSNKEEVLSYLLNVGANPNARSNDNLTPVHIAAMWNNYFELEKLIQNGGNPWLTDIENKNAFDMAADHHAYEAYQLLNQYLADNKLNFRRNTAYDSESHIDFFNQTTDSGNSTCYSDANKNSFYFANEYFPLIFSSDDESKCYLSDISQILRKNKYVSKDSEHSAMTNACNEYVAKDNEHSVMTNVCNNNVLKDKFCVSKCVSKNLFDNAVLNDKKQSNTYKCTTQLKESNNINDAIFVEEWSSLICTDPKSFNSTTFIINNGKSDLSSAIRIPEKYFWLSDDEIFQELQNLGEEPGPINRLTREVYLKRLTKLKSGCFEPASLPDPKYCPEIYSFLDNKLDMMQIQGYVQTLLEEFDNSIMKEQWREGGQRSCFNYFLLDPRVTQNLPVRYAELSFEETFQVFLDSVFYVGKGTKARSYDHLLDAVKALTDPDQRSAKIEVILDIWNSGFGVISLHCFNNCVPVEAYTQEACIIEAIGLKNLTNVREGVYYGQSTKWTRSRKRQIGVSLLNRAFHIFLCEGEKQIKPRDLRKK